MGILLLDLPLELRFHIWSLIDLPPWMFQDSIGRSSRDVWMKPITSPRDNNYRFRLTKDPSGASKIHPQALVLLGAVCKQIRFEIASLVPRGLGMEGILAQAVFLVHAVDDLYVMSRSQPDFVSFARHIRLATRNPLGEAIAKGTWSRFPRLRGLEWVSIPPGHPVSRELLDMLEGCKLNCTGEVEERTIRGWVRPEKMSPPCYTPHVRSGKFSEALAWASH